MRVDLMIKRDADGKADFAYQTVQQARKIIWRFIKDENTVEKIVSNI